MNGPPERAILVTGCSSGIGRCAAAALLARGYRVFAAARRQGDLDALAAEGFEPVALDLACSASIRAAVEHVLAAGRGRLYGLFNNAGFSQPGALESISRDDLRAQFEVNVFGLHELTVSVLPAMRAAGAGRIVQNSSILGLVGLKYRGAYAASKFALEGLTDTLRLELAGSGIHVALIEPGPIQSRFRENALRAYRRSTGVRGADGAAVAVAGMYSPVRRQAFALPPEAVLKALIHALESDRPRARYPVTLPAVLLGRCRRLLPDRLLDKLLLKVSEAETR